MPRTLTEVEVVLDAQAKRLDILRLPLRTVLGHAYNVVDILMHGSRLVPGRARRLAAFALISRLSYLLPLLLERCDVEQVGANATNALEVVAPEHLVELNFLLQYGHFSELVPEVHRGWYRVESTGDASYILSHSSPSAARHEMLDVVLSHIAMPQEPAIDTTSFSAAIAELAREAPRLSFGLYAVTLRLLFDAYFSRDNERPPIGNQGFRDATGVSWETFRRFRAGWAACAICNLLIAASLSSRARGAGTKDKERLVGEIWEWIMPLLNTKFIDGLLHTVTGVSFADYDCLMRFFVIEAESRKAPQAGDGFFPPILRIKDSYFFSSDVVRATMSTRNILYAANKLNPDSFSKLVANHMEPALVVAALELFRLIPELTVVPNVRWDKGEIDVLVFSPSENAALHIQAKAAIPPEGARMTKAVELRISEALQQLKKFKAQGRERIDQILTQALKREVRAVSIYDVVLSWSCFGRTSIWEQMEDCTAISLPLLFAVVQKFKTERESQPLSRLRTTALAILDRWCEEATSQWRSEKATIGTISLELPYLELDADKLHAIRGMAAQR